eukprot:6175036-Pleurochrysis_carterae.AAC.1
MSEFVQTLLCCGLQTSFRLTMMTSSKHIATVAAADLCVLPQARSWVGFGDAYGAVELQRGGEKRVPAFATLVLRDRADAGFDDICRHMTERHLSQVRFSTRVSSCKPFSGFAEAHEVTKIFIRLTIAMERYLEPESLDVADSDYHSDSTSSDDD